MRIDCVCGAEIRDQTDYLSFKAHFVADQDFFDLLAAVDRRLEDAFPSGAVPEDPAGAYAAALERLRREIHETLWHYLTRAMWQCPSCGRLYVDSRLRQSLHLFEPEPTQADTPVLRSIEGDQWKRPLVGRWDSTVGAGELWWIAGYADDGSETFADWETLKCRYEDMFQRLKTRRILRHAWLRKDGETVHEWSPPPRADTVETEPHDRE